MLLAVQLASLPDWALHVSAFFPGRYAVEAMQACGCQLHNAYMQLSLLALVVIPELRISDLGLVDVTQFQHIPVIKAG